MPGPEKHEQAAVTHTGGDVEHGARNELQQQALRLFQCKDGSLVNKPMDCTKTVGETGFLDIPPIAQS